MPVRPAALTATAALVAALTAPLVAPGGPAAAATSAAWQYSCLAERSSVVPDPQPFTMPVDATIEARPSGASVALSLSTGRPVIPGIESQLDVRMTSTLATTVDGVATQLRGSRDVSIRPGQPTDLPVLTGSVTSSAAELTLLPGSLRMEFTYLLWTVGIGCIPTTAPAVRVPVEGRAVTPAPEPDPAVKPVLTAGLTTKVQRVGRTPAKVKVRLARPAGTSAAVAGRVVVKVGAKKLATRTVTDAVSFRVALPKKLKPGRHKVTVTYTPAVGTTAYARATASAKVRVRR